MWDRAVKRVSEERARRKSRGGTHGGETRGHAGAFDTRMNSARSCSVSIAMDLLQRVELGFQPEEREIFANQGPIEWVAAFRRATHQHVDVTPIPIVTRRIVDRRLNLQDDDVFDVNDREVYAVGDRNSLGAREHSQSGPAKRVQQVDPAQGGVRRQVMGDVFRLEFPVIPESAEQRVGGSQVIQQKNEIDIQSGALSASESHREPTDQRVTDPGGIKRGYDPGNGFFEVHVRGGGSG